MTSTSPFQNSCITLPGKENILQTPYTFAKVTSNPSYEFHSLAMGYFLGYLGLPECDGGEGGPAIVSSTDVTTTSKAPETLRPLSSTHLALSLTSPIVTPASGASVSPLSQGHRAEIGLSLQSKIGIGIGAALALLIAPALVGWGCLRYRKRRLASNHAIASQSAQPYFQQKGELEAQERREYELHHEECRYELEENEVREIATTEEEVDMTALQRPELRGDDHLKELASKSL